MDVYLTARTFAGHRLCHDTIVLAHRFFDLGGYSATDIRLDGLAALKLLCCYPNTLPRNTAMLRKAAAEVLPWESYRGNEAKKRKLVNVVLDMLACGSDGILRNILRQPEFDLWGETIRLRLTGAQLPVRRLPRSVTIYKPVWNTVHLSEGALNDVSSLELVDAKAVLAENLSLGRATIQLSGSVLKGKKATPAEIYDSVVQVHLWSSIHHVNFHNCVVMGEGYFTSCSFKRCYIEGRSFTDSSAEDCVLPGKYTVANSTLPMKKLVRIK
jgi:hypothetical protein